MLPSRFIKTVRTTSTAAFCTTLAIHHRPACRMGESRNCRFHRKVTLFHQRNNTENWYLQQKKAYTAFLSRLHADSAQAVFKSTKFYLNINFQQLRHYGLVTYVEHWWGESHFAGLFIRSRKSDLDFLEKEFMKFFTQYLFHQTYQQQKWKAQLRLWLAKNYCLLCLTRQTIARQRNKKRFATLHSAL